MSAFSFSLEGADKVLANLSKLPKSIQDRIDAEIEDTVRNIEGKAVRRAPADMGALRQGIGVDKIGKMAWSVSSSKDYSAYIEFGTGTFVNVPSGLEEYAMQFKGKGIRQVNLPARPFFFPAYFEEKKRLIEDLKKYLSNL